MKKTLTDLENETIKKAIPSTELFNEYDKIELDKIRLSLLRIRRELKNRNTWDSFVEVLLKKRWWIQFSRRKNILIKLRALWKEEQKEEE